MESNARATALKMNRKEKKWSIRRSELKNDNIKHHNLVAILVH